MTDQQSKPKTFLDFAGVEWLYVENADLDGAQTRIPYSPDVVEHFAARGWQPVDPPDETIPTVAKAVDVPEGGEWVTLGHPDLGTTHPFPNNRDALQGAYDAGWSALNADGSVPKRQKPLHVLAEEAAAAANDRAPAPRQRTRVAAPENPDADPASETQQDEAGDSTATTKEG